MDKTGSKTILFTLLIASIIPCTTLASFPKIGEYTPLTEVSDRAALSNDQRIINEFMLSPTGSAFKAAKALYENGGSSRPIATVFVPNGVPQALLAEDLVTAIGVDGRLVTAVVLEGVLAGETEVPVRYLGTGSFQRPHDCIVGSLPRNERLLDGCLNSTGTMVLDTPIGSDTVSFEYQYILEEENTSGRSLQKFSKTAETMMRVGGIAGNPYYASFQPFVDYYGRADYADHIIQACTTASNTELVHGNLNMASAEYSGKALAQVFKKATAYVIMSMAVLLELENAVYECDSACNIGDCNEDPNVFSLDEAVAYFKGQHDVFASALNQLRCFNFGTCFELPSIGDATANVKAYQLFGEMQDYLNRAQCDDARGVIPKIASQIWIGIIQGTLRYAWITDQSGANPAPRPTEVAQAEGAIFAAGILPMIEKCNQESAKTIYDNLAASAFVNADFVAVKEAFESCYDFLGIDCGEVGGVSGGNGNFYDACSTVPCGGSEARKLKVPEDCVLDDAPSEGSMMSSVKSWNLETTILVCGGLLLLTSQL